MDLMFQTKIQKVAKWMMNMIMKIMTMIPAMFRLLILRKKQEIKRNS